MNIISRYYILIKKILHYQKYFNKTGYPAGHPNKKTYDKNKVNVFCNIAKLFYLSKHFPRRQIIFFKRIIKRKV